MFKNRFTQSKVGNFKGPVPSSPRVVTSLTIASCTFLFNCLPPSPLIVRTNTIHTRQHLQHNSVRPMLKVIATRNIERVYANRRGCRLALTISLQFKNYFELQQMGINNLTDWIKALDGIQEDLTKHRCEVDFSSMFFALVNALSFHATVEFAAKSARRQMSTQATTSTQQASFDPEMEDAGMFTHATTSTQQSSTSPEAGISTYTTTSISQASSGVKRAADVDDANTTDTASPNKRLRPLRISSDSSTLVEDMEQLLETQPYIIRFDETGSLTTTCAQEKAIVSTMNHTI